jgi:DNA polymerase-3 subunit delta'
MSDFIIPRLEKLDSQTEVQAVLKRLLDQKTVQTMLWTGPVGSGKKTYALALTRTLFCEKGEDCTGCQACHQVLHLTHSDLFWLEREQGKNEISVEAIRDLEKKLSNAPLSAPVKVAVIPEAGKMNRDAQNAFLKTLEEPPAKTLVILLAERTANFLPTVLSRCRPVRFGALSTTLVESLLVKSYAWEKPKARAAAEFADGNMTLALQFANQDWMDFVAKVQVDFDRALTGGEDDWLQTASLYDQMEPDFLEEETLTASQRKAEVAKAALRIYAGIWNRRLLNQDSIPNHLGSLPPDQVLRSIQKHLDIIPSYLSPRMVLDHLFLELREGFKKGEIVPTSFIESAVQI